MSTLVESLSGMAQSDFVQGGGLASILRLVTSSVESSGSIAASRQEAAAIEAQGVQQKAQAEFEASKLEREKKAMRSRQRALYAKAGVELTSGSPLEVMVDTAKEYEADIEQVRRIGALSYLTAKKQAKNVSTAGMWRGGSTILSGLSEFVQSPLLMKRGA